MLNSAVNTTNYYINLLNPLSDEAKLNIIHALTTSMLKEKESKSRDLTHFFDGLSNSWDDGITPEETSEEIRKMSVFGRTRHIESL